MMEEFTHKSLFLINLGEMEYKKALDLQHFVHSLVQKKRIPGALLTVQHPSVLTLGKHATEANICVSHDLLRQRGVDLVRVERGGEVTAHNLGQLVVYPILPISQRMTPRQYISILEKVVLDLLSEFGIKGRIDEQYPGVWVDDRKICALGIRIEQRVSYHGLALNISNEMDIFDLIIPCGIKNRSVTSMLLECGVQLDYSEVKNKLCDLLLRQIGISFVPLSEQQLLETYSLSPYDPPLDHSC